MIVKCRKCSGEIAFEIKVGFRDLCPNCGAYLHSCLHCRFLDENTSLCLEPMAEKVRDMEAGNFCDYFFPAVGGNNGGNPPEGGGRNEAEAMWKKLTGKS